MLSINKTAVIEPSFDQLSVGDHIEYKFIGKKGKMQLWCRVVVSNELETTSKRTRCRRTGTTTKEASLLNTTDSDKAERRTAATSFFENSSSTKGKRQKHPSSSPLPGAGPKRKCGRVSYVSSVCS